MVQYQSFSDVAGDSDSIAKLTSLRLPERLDGKSVLDIGCNEGFFCQEAWRRGAKRVVGLDNQPTYISRARQRDPHTEYHLFDWSDLQQLDETFDVILLLSALHYADDPRRLLRAAFRLVNPHGMLILECGVALGNEPKLVRVERPVGDVVHHPTLSMIESAFPAGVVRRIGPSVNQPGDQVRRFVFRVTRRKAIVMLIAGQGGSGKSTLAQQLQSDSVRVVSLDSLIWTLPDWCPDERLVKLAQSKTGWERVGAIGELFAAEGVERLFVDAVISAGRIPLTPQSITVVEGHVLGCGETAAILAEQLTDLEAYVWHVRPSQSRPSVLGGKPPLDGPAI
jgi:ubiquinone/menaquinone biosynthesis C-methylase UbiE